MYLYMIKGKKDQNLGELAFVAWYKIFTDKITYDFKTVLWQIY